MILAAVMLLSLVILSDMERPIPEYYVGAVRVTGTYTRQDVEGLLHAVRSVTTKEAMLWVRVPLDESHAFARGDRQELSVDVAEVWIGGPAAGTMYTVRRRDGTWTISEPVQWIR